VLLLVNPVAFPTPCVVRRRERGGGGEIGGPHIRRVCSEICVPDLVTLVGIRVEVQAKEKTLSRLLYLSVTTAVAATSVLFTTKFS
jgi:hypothetical protein